MFDENLSPIVSRALADTYYNKRSKLNLNNCELKAIPLEVFQFDWLEELILSNNEIEFIPPLIANLTNLRILDFTNNGIKEIPKEISKIRNLTHLGFHNNSLLDIHEEIYNLGNLQVLGLNNNTIKSISDKVLKLGKLKLLGLKNNGISRLPFNIIKIPNLINLYLEGNPLISPPIEIAQSENNINSIKHYFLTLNNKEIEEDFLFEMKLLVVGSPGVGKTNLTEKISESNFQFNPYHHSTEGVDIKKWIIPVKEFERTTNNLEGKTVFNRDLRINIWDFGGQEIYHATHQFFFTKRSIYLLVTESRRDENLDFWLHSIELLGDKSPVIVVQSKCDKPLIELPFSVYKERFYNIIDFDKVSCYSNIYDHTISSLKFKLYHIIADKDLVPHLGSILPKPWINIRNELESLRQEVNYISIEKYFEICHKYGIDEDSALYVSDFLHDIGVILHFQYDIDLNQIVFLNYNWVTKGVYTVLDSEMVIGNSGRFDIQDLDTILKSSEYKFKKHEILSLMRKFELCYEVEKNKQYLVPELLKKKPLKIAIDDICDEHKIDKTKRICVSYSYDYMPKGIMAKMIVKLNRYIFNDFFWRFGVFLKDGKTIAYLSEDYLKKKIEIVICGKERKEMLGLIRSRLKEVHDVFTGLIFIEEIPCTECRATVLPKPAKPHYFSLYDLNRFLEKDVLEIRCPVCVTNFRIIDLLEGVSPTSILPIIINLIKKNRVRESLDVLENKLTYHKEFEFVNELAILKREFTQLEQSFRQGLITVSEYTLNINNISNKTIKLAEDIERGA